MAYGVYGQGLQLNDGNQNTPVILTQGVPRTAFGTATLTVPQISYRILVGNPSTTAATYTTPTAASLDTSFPNAQVNSSFDVSIINIGTSTGTVTVAGGSGVTLVGDGGITAPGSASFRFRKTGNAAWSVYRIG